MSRREFDTAYSRAYDALYREKDYAAECDLLEKIFREQADGRITSILDLGCGTGNHSLPLADRGYDVLGVDRSPCMLEQAQAKAEARADGSKTPRFVRSDLRELELDATFDAVLFMFAVLGYQLDNADVLTALRTARRHVRLGGLLIFDVWYGPAVLSLRPGERVKVNDTADGQLIRATSGRLDVDRHLCEVSYTLWQISAQRLVEETTERHGMRYFFPQELRLFLDLSGFELLRLTAFPSTTEPCDDTTWNALVVARADTQDPDSP